MNKKRDENALLLDSLLADVEGIKPQGRKEYATLITHYMYMFYYNPNYFNGLSRKEFVDYLIAEGIPAFICFPVLSDTTFFRNRDFYGRINTFEQFSIRIIFLIPRILRQMLFGFRISRCLAMNRISMRSLRQ